MYRLRLLIDTSINQSTSKHEEFTSKMLVYEPPKKSSKMDLDTMPHFTTKVPYRDIARNLLNLPYYQRIEIFFNRNRFQEYIMNSLQDHHIDTPQQTQENFDIFIKAIFPTAYPVMNNYNKSIEYFDNSTYSFFSGKGSTKGLSTSYFPFLPSRFGKAFSHLMLNGEKHTITGVTLKNDVFNHPVYLELINTYDNISTKTDDDKSPKIFINRNYFAFIKEYFFKNDSGKTKRSVFVNIEDTDYISSEPGTIHTTDPTSRVETQQLTDSIKQIVEIMKPSPPPPEPTIEILKPHLNNMRKITEKHIGKVLKNDDQRRQIIAMIQKYQKLWVYEIAVQYIDNKDFDLSKEGDDQDTIRRQIDNLSTGYSSFVKKLADMKPGGTRLVANKTWLKLIENNLEEYTESNSVNIISQLLACRQNNSKCSDIVDTYLQVELDKVKLSSTSDNESNTSTNTFKTIEAYVMFNVIEGDMNKNNYRKLNCPYLDKSLGSMLKSFFNKNTWDLNTKKIFFSIKDALKELNDKEVAKEERKSLRKKKRDKKKQKEIHNQRRTKKKT
jgi:hypothetical protein